MRKDNIEIWFEHGVHPKLRTIYLGGAGDEDEGEKDNIINSASAQQAIKGLIELDSCTDQGIKMILNSPGGYIYHGWAIYDAICMCKNHIEVIVLGHAMSMATTILQAADTRTLGKSSTMMLHYGEDGSWGHPEDVIRSAKETVRLKTQMEDNFLKRIREKHPKYTRKKLKDLILFDKYFSPKEAIELGLADKILGE